MEAKFMQAYYEFSNRRYGIYELMETKKKAKKESEEGRWSKELCLAIFKASAQYKQDQYWDIVSVSSSRLLIKSMKIFCILKALDGEDFNKEKSKYNCCKFCSDAIAIALDCIARNNGPISFDTMDIVSDKIIEKLDNDSDDVVIN